MGESEEGVLPFNLKAIRAHHDRISALYDRAEELNNIADDNTAVIDANARYDISYAADQLSDEADRNAKLLAGYVRSNAESSGVNLSEYYKGKEDVRSGNRAYRNDVNKNSGKWMGFSPLAGAAIGAVAGRVMGKFPAHAVSGAAIGAVGGLAVGSVGALINNMVRSGPAMAKYGPQIQDAHSRVYAQLAPIAPSEGDRKLISTYLDMH